MLVVKSIIYIAFIFLFVNSSFAQQIIGEYDRKDPITAARNIGVHFQFKKGGNFIKTKYMHLGKKNLSKGTYYLIADTLFLKYEKLESQKDSIVQIIYKEKIKNIFGNNLKNDYLYTEIRVFTKEKIPLSGVHLLMRNVNGQTIMAFISDEKGMFPYFSIYDRYVEDFQLSSLGRKEIIIPTDPLFGYSTKINVYLSNAGISYESEKKVLKYLVNKISENQMILTSLKDNEKVVLKKSGE